MRKRLAMFAAGLTLAAVAASAPQAYAKDGNLTCTTSPAIGPSFTLTQRQYQKVQSAPIGATTTINGYTVEKTGPNTFLINNTTIVALSCS